MRWRAGRRSTNVEDIRAEGMPRRMPAGMQIGGGAALLLLLVSLLLGGDPGVLLDLLSTEGGPPPGHHSGPRNDEAADFVSVVLADTEDTWGAVFASAGQAYRPPKLVLYADAVESACGLNAAATGPFYCPGDRKVYLDLSFLSELSRLGAAGDFAVAYVIAHEIGHHVQNLVGTAQHVGRLQRQASQAEAKALSVRTELQADCFAGVWAHHAQRQRQVLEQGDIEEGVQAAAAVGDDRLQRMAGRRVSPDAFTHGSSTQRVQWFRTGLQTGSVEACNTFAEPERP
jgi:uncharacterized protein